MSSANLTVQKNRALCVATVDEVKRLAIMLEATSRNKGAGSQTITPRIIAQQIVTLLNSIIPHLD